MEKGTKLLRARLNTPGVYHIFNLVFAALVAGILAIILFFNVYTFGGIRFSWYTKLGVAVSVSLFSLLLFWMLTHLKKPKIAAEITVVALFMVGLVCLQGFVGWQAWPSGEATGYGQVYQLASNWVLGQAQPGEYFLHHMYEIAPYTLLCGVFSLLHLFDISDFWLPSMVLNGMAISGAALLLYFTTRRLFGVLTAMFVLLAACLTSPFWLYAPLAGTNTLLLPIPVAAVLLWLGARSCWREGKYKGAILRFCILSGLLGLGALFRLPILVLWLAVVADLLFLLCGKGKGLMLLAGTGALAAVLVGGMFALLNSPLVPAANYIQDGMPFSRGLLMGLSQTGGYNQADEDLLLTVQGRAARGDLAIQEAQNRLESRGVLGEIQHLGDKLSHTFGDGSYGAAAYLQGNAANGGALGFLTGGVMSLLYFAVEAATLFWMLMAAVRSFMRRNEALTFVRLAVFGLVIFLLLWETQPGYLVCFLPLFLLCAAEAGPRPVAVRHHLVEPQTAKPQENEPLAFQEESPASSTPDYMNPDFKWEAPVAPQWQSLTPPEEEGGAEKAQPLLPEEPDLFKMMQEE